MSKPCDRCSVSFEPKESGQRFCSYACYRPVYKNICAKCGLVYRVGPTKVGKKGFCSFACRAAAVAKCENCGVEFKETAGKPNRFCSHKCFHAHGRLDRSAPPPPAVDGMTFVPLGHETFAMIDDADAFEVMKNKWHLSHGGYAVIGRTGMLLHRLVMNPTGNEQIDHRNGNRLDCRKSNLRRATMYENARNRAGTPGKLKGIRRTATGRWAAHIGFNGSVQYLGTFDTDREAAIAYDDAARRLHGEFARLNFPRGGEQPAHGTAA